MCLKLSEIISSINHIYYLGIRQEDYSFSQFQIVSLSHPTEDKVLCVKSRPWTVWWWQRILEEGISESHWLGLQPSLRHSFFIFIILDYLKDDTWSLFIESHYRDVRCSQSTAKVLCAVMKTDKKISFCLLSVASFIFVKKLLQWLNIWKPFLNHYVVKSDLFIFFMYSFINFRRSAFMKDHISSSWPVRPLNS